MTRKEPEKSSQQVSGIDYSLKLKEARNILKVNIYCIIFQLMIIILQLLQRLRA